MSGVRDTHTLVERHGDEVYAGEGGEIGRERAERRWKLSLAVVFRDQIAME